MPRVGRPLWSLPRVVVSILRNSLPVGTIRSASTSSSLSTASARREADRLIEAGRVTVNATVAKLGDQVSTGDVIACDGRVIPWGQTRVYIKYHKPVGVTTTSESHIPRNIISEIGHPERIFPSAGWTRIPPA